jgi:uncharacterized membrane protein YccC
MWFSTVRSEIVSSKAIWRLVSPRATRSAISCSRVVSLSARSSAGGGRWSGAAARIGDSCSSSTSKYPEREAKAWFERFAALDRKRGGYLDLAAEGIMDRDELRAKLAELQEDRETAEREIAAIEGRRERLEQMERDRDTAIEHCAGTVPEALDDLSPEERHQIYKMLRLEVLAYRTSPSR